MDAGIILALAAMACWGAADFVSKNILSKITVREQLAWSTPLYALFLLLALPFMWHQPTFTPANIAILVLAAIIMALGNICFLGALAKDQLSLVTALSSAYPLITIGLSILVLGESIGMIEMAGIVLALAGITLASLNELGDFKMSAGVPLIIASVVFWGVGFLFHKLSVNALGGYATALLVALIQAIIIVPFVMKHIRAAPKAKVVHLTAIAMALLSAGWLAFSIAMETSRLSILAPLSALFPVVAIALGFIFLKERLKAHQWIGVCAVLIGIVAISV